MIQFNQVNNNASNVNNIGVRKLAIYAEVGYGCVVIHDHIRVTAFMVSQGDEEKVVRAINDALESARKELVCP